MAEVRHTGIEFSQSEVLRAYAAQLHLKQIARLLRASRMETARATGHLDETPGAGQRAVTLSEELAQRLDAVLDLLNGNGVAEAQMSFALRTKNRTGNGGDVRLVKENLRRGAAVLMNFLDVGKHIKRTSRRRTFQPHFAQPGNQQIAAPAVFLTTNAISLAGVSSAWSIAYCTGVVTPFVE